jgi:signal peptidase II
VIRIKRKYTILVVLTAFVILLDQITKYVIVDRFRYGESIPVIPGFFSLTYIRNTGAAFGLLAHSNPAFRIPFFVIVPIVALVAIAFIFRKIPDKDLKLSTALSLVIGGAIGNLIDRVQLSYVVDFLDFHWKYEYHFPAFNVADTAICIGVGVLMLDLLSQPATQAADGEKKETPINASAPH